MNVLLAWWRSLRLKRLFQREARRGIAIARGRWREYWGTICRVPLGNPTEKATKALAWHVSNFAEALAPMLEAECPTVLLDRRMMWLVVANGILEAKTHDAKIVGEAINEAASGDATL